MSCLTLYVVNACVSTCVYDCRSSVCARAHACACVWAVGVYTCVCVEAEKGEI